MDRQRQVLIPMLFILVAVATITVVALAGIVQTRSATLAIRHDADLRECAREVSAGIDEQFRQSNAEFLQALLDRNRADAVRAAYRMEHLPNLATETSRLCKKDG